MNKNINIPGRLHSVATDGQVAGANEIYDDEQQKFQGEINAELHEEMEDTKEVVDSFDNRVKAIEDLAEISIEGGEVQVANTAEEIVAGSGKVPTANALNERLTSSDYVDDVPTAGSDNLVKSAGVYEATVKNAGENIDFSSNGYYLNQNGELAIAATDPQRFDITDFVEVKEGDILFYKGYNGSASIASSMWGYTKKLYTSAVVELIPANSSTNEVSIIIPAGINYICAGAANDQHELYQGRYLRIKRKYDGKEKFLSGTISDNTENGGIDLSVNKSNFNVTKQEDFIKVVNDFGMITTLANSTDLKNSSDIGFAPFQGAVVTYTDGYFDVDVSSRIGDYPGVRNNLIGKLLKKSGKDISIKFDAKYRQSSPQDKLIAVYLAGPIKQSLSLSGDWDTYTLEFTSEQVSCADRLQISVLNVTSSVINLGFCIKNVEIILKNSVADKVNKITKSLLTGKKISVIGDSISTINGNNNPYWKVQSVDVGQTIQSYVTWWDVWSNNDGTIPTNKTIGGVALTAEMIGTLQSFTPVAGDVGKEIGVALNYNSSSTKVWSQCLCEKTGAILLANASWSGSRICGGQSQANVLSEAWSEYTIGRCKLRNDVGNTITPDVIIIYRGTNDFSHVPISRLGEVSLMNGVPETDLIGSNYEFRAGYYKTIQKLREAYPNAYIVCCTLNVFKRMTYDVFPTRNPYYTLPQMNDAIREIANVMGCGLIEFDKDGITFENCYAEGYITDSAITPTHPNSKGHAVMAERALVDLNYCL